MKMRLYFLSVIVLASLHPGAPVSTVTVYNVAAKTVEIIQNLVEVWMDADKFVGKNDNLIYKKLDTINDKFSELNQNMEQIEMRIGVMEKIEESLPDAVRFNLQLDAVTASQNFIKQYTKDMDKYVTYHKEYENSTLNDFANHLVSQDDNSVKSLITRIDLVVRNQRFLTTLQQTFQPRFCKSSQSTLQIYQNLLNSIITTYLEGLVLTQSAYMFKKMTEKGNFKREIKEATDDFHRRTNHLIKTMKPYMVRSSLEVWGCDPQKHVPGESYTEITNFLHGFILNKVSLDKKGQCREECDTFTYTTNPKCKGNRWCEQQKFSCPTVVNCRYVDSSMSVCQSSMTDTNRRYQYIEFDSKGKYGKGNKCENPTSLETYRFWVVWKCSYCFCLCDEGPKFYSDRFINLRLSSSNITGNKIVTGLRFIKHNRIIHLQVQEGKLLSYGQIDIDSLRWVPPDDYKITDNDIIDGEDYHTISWNERSLELVDIIAKKETVVTGVRFVKIRGRLNLEMQTTPFNFTSGQLFVDRTSLQRDPRIVLKSKFGRELKLKAPDVPILARPNEFTTNKFVRFTHSDFPKDAGQTTVPFFDSVNVTSTPPVPLSGIGVFHKGRSGYGGFIAPRMFTYNFTQHLEPVFKVVD